MDPFSSAILFGGMLSGGFGLGSSHHHSSNSVNVNVNESHCHHSVEEKKEEPKKETTLSHPKEAPKEAPKKKETIVYQGESLPSKPDNLGYKKNRFGNFEMPQTRFVMNLKSRLIIGVQKTDGTVRRLEDKEKLICEAWDLRYKEYAVSPPSYE